MGSNEIWTREDLDWVGGLDSGLRVVLVFLFGWG